MKRFLIPAAALGVVLLAGCGGNAAPGEVKIEVTDAGFVPPVVTVPHGQPYTLAVTRRTDTTCATEIVFDATGQKYTLPMNETVKIAMPAADAETLEYACGMGMLKGQVVVR